MISLCALRLSPTSKFSPQIYGERYRTRVGLASSQNIYANPIPYGFGLPRGFLQCFKNLIGLAGSANVDQTLVPFGSLDWARMELN